MQKLNFNSEWRFHLGDPQGSEWRHPDDVTSWRLLTLPHDWAVELERTPDAPSGASGGFFQMGRGWYRKTFPAPEAWQGKRVEVEFEGVYMNAEVWFNNHFLGRHPYGYTSFIYDLTPYLKQEDANVLTVVVDNACHRNSRWYSGSGMYRPVWLRVSEPVHVAPWGVFVSTPEVSNESTTVLVETTIKNDADSAQQLLLRSHIVAAEGEVVATTDSALTVEAGASRVVQQEIALASPRLWSPDQPAMYRLETELAHAESGTLIDAESTPFGVRSISFDAQQGFLLNGEAVLLRGGCVHHDNGVLGAASYDRSEERKVELLKASGFNAVRCAHNPPSPAFLDACDRLGMMVMDEAFDCWREGKNPYDYHVAFSDWWQRDIDSMLLRDRNHPSIIMWSIGNEIGERDGRSEGVTWAQTLASRIRELDPTRAISAGINGVRNWQGIDDAWHQTDGVFEALDVGGYNYREVHYRSDHERLPNRVMVGTESTAMEAAQHWNSVVDLPYVIGDFVWTSLDYLGESGIGRVRFDTNPNAFLGDYPWHQAYCGDLDLCGFKRPQSYFRDVLWGVGPGIYIAVHQPLPSEDATITYWGWPLVGPDWTWPGEEGKSFKVDVYSACKQVELFLNERSLGVKPAGRDAGFMATFEVPYEPGTLRAVGCPGCGVGCPDATQPDAAPTFEITTVGDPVSLRLTPDRDMLQAMPGDLSFITVEVVDGQGRVHPKGDHEVHFTVEGAGVIAAVGSGNPVSEESYTAAHRKAHEGRCLLVVKTTGEKGGIHVRATADDLAPANVSLAVGKG
jgi:beta-galactosidase